MERNTGEKVRQRIAGKAIIQYMSKVLILEEAKGTYKDGTNPGRYQLPGGRIEPGEPFEQGLDREVFEETGLHVVAGDLVYRGEWFPIIRGEAHQIVGIYVACRAQTDRVVLSPEHDSHVWVDMADYRDYNLIEPDDKALEAFFSRPHVH